MAEPDVNSVFGNGFRVGYAPGGSSSLSSTGNASFQAGKYICISIPDLANTGLFDSGAGTYEHTAESLLVAIILKAKDQLTQQNFDLHLEQNLVITERSRDTIQRNGATWNRINLNVALHLLVDNTAIDPDDY